ncbi:ArgS-related anticodon-binding protein NrtL [Streptomyces sp. NPDC051684]|uniref:ArgS-related anticodon-binding protein NrtL n=1 Tax=Streptomyces sp. NPDC051684 TaxID=3365670 RepID=UPI0037882AED
MTPAELSRTVLRAVRRAVDDGELDVAVCAAEQRVVVERPRPGGQGDYATNVALQLARPAGRPPREVAEILSRRLNESPGVARVVVTGPGFLNVSVAEPESAAGALVAEILRAGDRYGYVEEATGRGVRLYAPHEVRALVVMDSVARLLRSQGVRVRTSCADHPRPEWLDVLDVRVDATDGPGPDAPASPDVSAAGGPTPDAPASPDADAAGGPTPDTTASPDIDATAGSPPDATGGPAPATTMPDADADADAHLRPVPAPADPTPLGRDAARWALLHPAAHDHPRIGAEPAEYEAHLAQRESNPLFRVRYAHARTRALTRNAADLGFAAHPGGVPGQEDLLGALGDHPRILRAAAEQHAPDRLARHLVGVADTFMATLHPSVLPQGEEKPSAAHRSRLALAEAVGTVLAGGLTLLGIDAPEHL